MNIIPVLDRILIKLPADQKEEVSVGGIIMVNSERVKPNKALVISVGPQVGVTKPGDEIYFTKHAGTYIVIDAIPHLVINEADVLAVIKDQSCTLPINKNF